MKAVFGVVVLMCVGCNQASEGPQVWASDSQSVDVDCFGFFQGSMKFRATRSQLSDAQIELLSKLVIVDACVGNWSDGMQCGLTVGGADGGFARYASHQSCEPSAVSSQTWISFSSFDPFRKTLNGGYAKDQTLVARAPDVRCFNGVFTADNGATVVRSLQVNDAGAVHHLELTHCSGPEQVGKIRLQLFADGGTPIAEGQPVVDDRACMRLDYAFPGAGTYVMVLGIDAGFQPAGDFYYRFF